MIDTDLADHIEAIRAGQWHASWGYHSRASVVHRYVAMPLPKVACTTLKITLQSVEGTAPPDDRLWEVHAGDAGPTLLSCPTDQIVEMLRSDDYLRFCFVRIPYARLFSAWKSKLAVEDPQYDELRAAIRSAFDYPQRDGERVGTVAFRDAVEFMFENPRAFDDHWNPQTYILLLDVIPYDVIGRFEQFNAEFSAILTRLGAPPRVQELGCQRFNATAPMVLAAAYDHGLAERVYDHYRADFETFDYDRQSWLFN